VPEGHVTHRIAHRLTDRFAGEPTRSSSPQGRFAAGAAAIDGHVLDRADAVGKHLFAWFGDRAVHVHLGRAGRLGFARGDERPVVGLVRWRLETDDWYADLAGPTVCELLAPDPVDAVVARLGPDPLRDDDPDRSWPRIHASRTPIAVLLMDQAIAAGVGNIFRSELLFRHRLDPMLAGRLLRRSEWLAMWDDLVTLMRYAVANGRIDTVRPEHEPVAMGRPPRVDRHGGEVYVYRRAGLPCLVCGARVRTDVVAGRNLFWCPRCQRRSRRQAPARPRLGS
jgi:formamidopyrimidine-DNA glycosylase